MEACHRGARHWLDRAMRLIHGGIRHWLGQDDGIASWGHAMGARNTGWIGALGLIREGLPWGHRALAGSGQWDWFMAVCGTGWIGWWDWFMGVFHGGVQRGLDQGNCIDLWGCVMGVCDWIGWWDWLVRLRHGARDTGWIREMGLIHGGMRHWLDRGNGFDWWGLATLAGPGRWDWFMGVRDTGWNGAMALIYGDASWGCTTGSGKWDWFVGARHGGATLAGCGRWDWVMGACHGGAQLDRVMELICGGEPWGHMTLTRSGRWDWLMWACNGGSRHWLDQGDGIDSWGRAKWQSNMVAEFKWRYHVSSCLVLR